MTRIKINGDIIAQNSVYSVDAPRLQVAGGEPLVNIVGDIVSAKTYQSKFDASEHLALLETSFQGDPRIASTLMVKLSHVEGEHAYFKTENKGKSRIRLSEGLGAIAFGIGEGYAEVYLFIED